MSLEQDFAAGMDFGWLAVDERGCVGLFFTAGEGPVPTSALPQSAADMSVEEELFFLPERTNCELHISYPRPDDFIAMAKRGIYAFDWGDVHRTYAQAKNKYELVAEPRMPIALAQLPTSLQRKAGLTLLSGIVFSASVASGVWV